MKKLLLTLACTLISTSAYIIGMEKEVPIESTQNNSIIELTNALYQNNLTPEKLIELHKQGAVIDRIMPQAKNPNGGWDFHLSDPLSHWVIKFNTDHTHENPYTTEECSAKGAIVARRKAIKDLKIITQLLRLGAKPTETFAMYYDSLLTHNLNKDNIKHGHTVQTLLKSKPSMNRGQIINIWQHTITEDNHEYVDLLIPHFTTEELQEGLIYCIEHHDDILKNFNNSYESCSKYLSTFIEKLLKKGVNPNYYLTCLANDVIKPEDQKITLDILSQLSKNGAYEESTINILEEYLEKIGKKNLLIIAALTRMKQNKIDTTSSTAASSTKEQ